MRLNGSRRLHLLTLCGGIIVTCAPALAAPLEKTAKFCPELSFIEASKQQCYRDKLKDAHAYTQALFKIMPWYPEEEIVPTRDRASFTGCGCRSYFVRQERVGARFRKAEMATGFLDTAKLKLAKPCAFKAGNKLKAAYGVVKAYLMSSKPDYRFKPGDKLISPDGWNLERHKISGKVIGQWGEVLHCSKKHTYQASVCGGADDTLACEQSRSNTAKAINVISWRLTEGKKYQSAGNKNACAVTSWAAVSTARYIKKLYEDGTKSGNWRQGLRYKTRYDGILEDKSAFALIDTKEAEAVALYKACEGDESMLPTEPRYWSLRSAY